MCDYFKQLISLIGKHPDFFDIGAPVSLATITNAQERLNAIFPAALVRYFSVFGTLAAGPLEYYGVIESEVDRGRVPDGTWFTERKREQLRLPEHYFVLLNNEGDEFHCVNLESAEIDIWSASHREKLGTKTPCIFEYIVTESLNYL